MTTIDQVDPKADQPVLLTISEAARLMGVMPSTVRAWILQKRIGSNKLGGKRLIPRDELNRLIKESFEPAQRELRNA